MYITLGGLSMIRVLQELASLDGGGVAKLLYDYYSNMDKTKVQFDFLIYNYYDEGIYEKPLEDLGCKIHKISAFKKDKKAYMREMEKIVKDGNYDVIHSHMGSRGLFLMRFGKKYKVKKRIVHSHIAFEPISKSKAIVNKMLSIVAKHYATDLFACGKDAGIYMWGKNAKVKIMTNAINTEAFKFSPEIRDEKRKELGVEDKFVLGIVGRLSEQKNFPYLFKVYKKVLEKRDDTVLLIAGRGLEDEKYKQMTVEMGISENVKFLGIRSDVPKLLNAFDMFILPSLYEGLPVVLIESQANGLLELVSDRVTDEMNVSDLINFLPINQEGADKWADFIANATFNTDKREQYSDIVRKNGYDINTQSKKMQEYYLT